MFTPEQIHAFREHLLQEEKSDATIEKYLRDVTAFAAYEPGQPFSKQTVICYKKALTQRYAPGSVNSMLVSVNAFLRFSDHSDCCVRLLKIQRQIFCSETKELTVVEYRQLLAAAAGTKTAYILQTICETGIRVSELQYITIDAVREGKAVVAAKNKTRVVFLSSALRAQLLQYIHASGITAGSVFVTRQGKPLDRSNIWRNMKSLCEKAGVPSEKVFPHNLRHLFARTFYDIDRDVVRLADLLGHSSINTTRIYTIQSGRLHSNCLEHLHDRLSF